MSPWHDLSLRPQNNNELDVFHGLIEITRNTTAKMEVETDLVGNPIVQTKRKTKRQVKSTYVTTASTQCLITV